MTATRITKDSGQRQEFSTGMKRDTQTGKPRYDLLLPKDLPLEEQPLYRWAMLMGRGAEKYDERNWEKARTQAELDRYISSLLRHAMQVATGQTDEDHEAACMFNIMGIMYVRYHMQKHDAEHCAFCDSPDHVSKECNMI
jgi:hypothetical protein